MPKKIKIVHVVYSFDKIGGLENGLINIINMLDKRYFSHVICSLTTIGSIRNRISVDNVEFYQLRKKPGNDVLLPAKLFKIFKKETPDIVHLRNWATMVEGFIASKLSDINTIIYSEHGRHFEDISDNKIIVSGIHRYVLNNVSTALSVSREVSQEMFDLYRMKQPVKTILNGVDTFKFRKFDKKTSRKKLGFQTDQKIVGSVGRLVKEKCFDNLIIDFLSNCNKGQLCIVGEGPEYQNLQNIISINKGLDRIRIVGHSDNIPTYMNCFDVFALPSKSEGLSNVLLEAMSCGLPIVAYNVGGNKELVTDQRGGYLVESDQRKEFIKKIKKLFEFSRIIPGMGQYNRAKVTRKFSLEIMIEKYSHLYTR